MTHQFLQHKSDTHRATLRPGCIPRAYLPGGALWAWVSGSHGRLSARDFLALAGRPISDTTTRSPEASPDTTPCSSTPEQQQQQQQQPYFPLPGFSKSEPRDPGNFGHLMSTEAYNPVRALQQKRRREAAMDLRHPAAGSSNDDLPRSKSRKDDPWTLDFSDAEHIFIHEISYKFPEAWQYLVVRLCERAGIPVPSVIRPADSATTPPASETIEPQQVPPPVSTPTRNNAVTPIGEDEPGSTVDPRKAA